MKVARARALMAVPVSTRERHWGMLVVLMGQMPLFPDDDLEMLLLLGEQGAMALDSGELLQRQQGLVKQLEAANKELEAFTYSVAHDLRAPLRSIDGFSQALMEDYAGKLDEQGIDFLTRVRRASQWMGRLIDDLLKLSRITRAEVHRQEFEISALVRSVAEEISASDPERKVNLVIMDGLVAQGDPVLVRAVLENLLSNSWKFTSRHPTATIEFGSINEQGRQVFFVKDDGAGFDMAFAGKLFAPFQRLHSREEFDGTGIGLATVHKIIQRHGGQVWAEGAVEKGATFYFIL